MALQEKHRTRLYAYLVDHIDEDTAEAVLAQFPSRDLDEPVTKEFVALTAAELRTQLAGVRTEMHQEFSLLRAEITEQLGELRTEIQQKLTAQDGKVDSLGADLHKQTERLMNRVQLMAGLVVVALAVIGVLTR